MALVALTDRQTPRSPSGQAVGHVVSERAVSIVAHRGASAYAPENTLPAIELGVAMGADTVEIDVQGTADGELVVMHDTTLCRTTDAARSFPGRRPWRVGDFTLAEIRRLDAGSWFGPEFAGTQVPTLEEVLETLRGRASLLLEVKRPTLYPGIVSRIARALEASRWPSDAVVVQSFDRGFVEAFHVTAPHLETGWLRNRVPRGTRLGTVRGWARHLNLHHHGVSARGLSAAREHGLRVRPWTVDEPRRMAQLLRLGVDGIITNRPDVLQGVLARR